MKQADVESYCKPLIGHQLLSIENRDYSWFFVFGEDVSVATESPWRLISEGRIIVASEDHGHQFGLPEPVDAVEGARSCLTGRSIEAATICASSGDLTIEFSGQVRLQLLQISCGYESWRLCIHGSQTICMGGGTITHFPAT